MHKGTRSNVTAGGGIALLALIAIFTMGARGGCLGPVDQEGPIGYDGPCVSDDDCTEGQICNASGQCEDEEKPCLPGEPGCDAPDPEPIGCWGPGDCPAGYFCDTDVCLPPPGCDEGEACPAVCYFQCRLFEEEPDDCLSDSDCAADQHCELMLCDVPCFCDEGSDCMCPECGGVCVDDQPPVGCESDADCDAGFHCEIARCDAAPAECDPNFADGCGVEVPRCMGEGMCVADDPEPPKECRADADCPGDLICVIDACDGCAGGGFAPDDGSGAPCPEDCWGHCGKPDDPEQYCMSDADCGPGEVCEWLPCPPCECADGSDNCDCAMCDAVGICVPEEPEFECSSDADCGPDAYCELMMCAGCACPDGDAGCDECEPSCWGFCMPKEPEPIWCDADTDCPAGTTCQCGPDPDCPECAVCAFQCLPEPAVECLSDADCAPDEFCALDYCSMAPCTDDGWCPPCSGTCQPKEEPVEGCQSDDECGPNEQCIVACYDCACPDNGEPCDCPWPPCIGECVPVEPPEGCQSDADCPAGSTCQCLPDPSCPECDVCYMACVPSTEPECLADADCPEGWYCDFGLTEPGFAPWPASGVCMPKEEPGSCSSDADCADDEFCNLDVYADPMPGVAIGFCEPKPPTQECVVTGCSGQICAAEPMATTCEWQPWYACYKLAECGAFGPDGGCGWLSNPEFEACIKEQLGTP